MTRKAASLVAEIFARHSRLTSQDKSGHAREGVHRIGRCRCSKTTLWSNRRKREGGREETSAALLSASKSKRGRGTFLPTDILVRGKAHPSISHSEVGPPPCVGNVRRSPSFPCVPSQLRHFTLSLQFEVERVAVLFASSFPSSLTSAAPPSGHIFGRYTLPRLP
jgi:hypothetical protein